jgi:hypothetical protein
MATRIPSVRLLPPKSMKQFNLPRAVLITCIVFLFIFVGGIVLVAARGNFTSRPSIKPAITTGPGEGVGRSRSSSSYASDLKAFTLSPPCTTDPIVVNNSDSGAGSLRQAIADACDASTITFNMALVSSPISLTTSELTINKNLTITGPGSSVLTIRRGTAGGTPHFRVLNINSGTVNITGVTVTNGRSPDGISGGAGGDGGGVLNAGTLTLTDVILTSNWTGRGSDSVSSGGNGGSGAGIANTGILTMTYCTIDGNSAGPGGTGNNSVGDGGNGGGIYNSGTLTMTNCLVIANAAGNAGTTTGVGGRGGSGGGIYSRMGSMTLTNVTVDINICGNVLAGNGGNNAFGGAGGGIFVILGTASLTSCAVGGNQTGTTNGGLDGYGGGIDNECPTTIMGSTIRDNTGNAAGAILNKSTLTIMNSTVSGNHTYNNSGSAILNSDSGSSITLTNGTITKNSGVGIDAGGGTATIRNSIIANNNDGGNAAAPDVSGSFNSQGNNLIGKSDGTNGFTNGSNGDQVGSVASPLDPRLAPLANNGGSTLTHALLTGSPAIDAGNNSAVTNPPFTAPPFTDQRGFNRIADGDGNGTAIVDIGAYELQGILTVDGVNPSVGRTSGGQPIRLIGGFANLSTVTMGGSSASWFYTNGGADTSAITVTTPAHSVGAVQIDLMPASGSPYSKPNAFAYLPTVFTDNTLVVNVTTVKAQHIIELRQAVDAMRAVAGLMPAPWTDAALTPGSSVIRAVHIQELRTYVDDATMRLGFATNPYTDPSLTTGYSIKRIHIEELRQRVRGIVP